MSNLFWQVDALMTSIEANNDRDRANAELSKAERYHRGSIAQLSAALNAIRKLAPDHALNHQAVLDVIDHDGESTSTFKQAWQLGHDPAEILVRLQNEFEKKRIETLQSVEQMPIVMKCKGWFWNRYDVFMLHKTSFLIEQHAIEAKIDAIKWLNSAKFGDTLCLDSILNKGISN